MLVLQQGNETRTVTCGVLGEWDVLGPKCVYLL